MNEPQHQTLECLLLPGMHGTNDLFSAFTTSLKDVASAENPHLTANALSYPRRGKQSYRALREWIKAEVDFTTNKVIIAESFSAPLALLLADEFPETVRAVVIAAGFCASPINSGLALLPLRPLFMVSPPKAAIRHFLLGEDAPKETVKALRDILGSVPAKTLAHRLRSVLTLEESELPSIPGTPVLLLQAQDDAVIPWANQNQLESHLSHAEIHWIESPHLLLQTKPQQCAQLVVQFLTDLNPIE